MWCFTFCCCPLVDHGTGACSDGLRTRITPAQQRATLNQHTLWHVRCVIFLLLLLDGSWRRCLQRWPAYTDHTSPAVSDTGSAHTVACVVFYILSLPLGGSWKRCLQRWPAYTDHTSPAVSDTKSTHGGVCNVFLISVAAPWWTMEEVSVAMACAEHEANQPSRSSPCTPPPPGAGCKTLPLIP